MFLFAVSQEANGKRLEGYVRKVLANAHAGGQNSDSAGLHWWSAEPGVCRVDDGTASRVDRLRALGNGIVPQQLALALAELFAGGA